MYDRYVQLLYTIVVYLIINVDCNENIFFDDSYRDKNISIQITIIIITTITRVHQYFFISFIF